jgi:hypothetical protein
LAARALALLAAAVLVGPRAYLAGMTVFFRAVLRVAVAALRFAWLIVGLFGRRIVLWMGHSALLKNKQ